MTATIAVLPALVTFQAIQLEDGRMLTMALNTPLQKFAIVHRDGEDLDVLALRDDQAEAVVEAKCIAGQFEAASMDGVTRQ